MNIVQARQAEIDAFSTSSSSLSEALVIQIKLLQDEMAKIDRQEEAHRLRQQLGSFTFPPLSAEEQLDSCSRPHGRSPERHLAAEECLAELEMCLKSVKEEQEGRKEGEGMGGWQEETMGDLSMAAHDHKDKIHLGK
jgi:hypothetical protein